MMTFTLKSCLNAAFALTIVLLAGAATAQAAILLDDHFDNDNLATDVNGVNGGFVGNATSAFTASEAGTEATFNATGDGATGGIFSINSFDPTAVSSYTATWVVTSFQTPGSNGFGLQIASDDSQFTQPWVQFVFDRAAAAGTNNFEVMTHNGTSFTTLIAKTITLGQALDGFTLTATFDATGISYTTTGIASLADDSAPYNGSDTYALLFDSTTHVGAHTRANGNTNRNFVLDRITIATPTAPEPSSLVLAALSIAGLALGRRRRRR